VIACRNCGSHNPPGAEFCGTCDEFLEWNGEQVSAGLDSARNSRPVPAAVSAGEPAVPAAVPPGPGADAPAPVQPQHRKPAPPPVPTEQTLRRAEGNRRCPRCSFGNGESRHFCARCGEVLASRAATASRGADARWPLRWWRAWQAWWAGWGRPSRPVVHPAGSRPRPGGLPPPGVLATRVALAVVAATGLVYAAVPAVRGAVHDAVVGLVTSGEQALPTDSSPVRPTRVSATSAVAEHPADAAVDGVTTTFWAAAATQPALDLTFDRPVVVDRAILRLGGTDQVQAWSRPRTLRVTSSDGRTQEVTVADQLDPQTVRLTAEAPITWLRVEVVAMYPSPTNRAVAVTEIELFGRSAS